MPKRSHQEMIDLYQRKIRRLEEKQYRKRIRVIESSDSDEKSDNELHGVGDAAPTNIVDVMPGSSKASKPVKNDSILPQNSGIVQEPVQVLHLDPEILTALGDAIEDVPKLGEKIHNKLAQLWTPILRKGLDKEAKEKLKKQFLIPENCSLLLAPKLNPEISAAVSDTTRLRDKRVENVQQQLGLGITALNRGLTLLLESDKDRVSAIKFLSDSCRILCDLHFVETEARKKFVTPGLDKSFTNLIQDTNRDDTLFGCKLSEKIKASKVIEKQGLQIKKIVLPNKTPATSTTQSTTSSHSRSQVNWTGPPRYSSSRGGRGGQKKTAPALRRATRSSTPKTTTTQSKQRAPTQP